MRLLNGLIVVVFLQSWALAGIDSNIAAPGRDAQRSGTGRQPASPDCSGTDQWPARMAFVQLKNDGITDNSKLDFNKTKTTRLASERIGRDLFRQVHRITFSETSGKTIEVITVNDASNDECSMSSVDVYVVGKHLGAK
jgi:hypothetical protein